MPGLDTLNRFTALMSAPSSLFAPFRRLLDRLWKKTSAPVAGKPLTPGLNSRAIENSPVTAPQPFSSATATNQNSTETVVSFEHPTDLAQKAVPAQKSITSGALVQTLPERKPNVSTQISETVENYLLALKLNHCSPATIRNYRSDIKQFCSFANEKDLDAIFTKPKLLEFAEEEIKRGLQPSSVKRKLISIAQFSIWARRGKLITDHRLLDSLDRAETPELLDFTSKAEPTSPAIQAQPVVSGVSTRPDPTSASTPRSLNLPSLPALPPTLVNRWLPYVNLGILGLFISGLAFFVYQQFKHVDPSLAYPATLTRPNRMLSFQGRLTNTADTPIVGATTMQFKLYNDLTAGTMLWDSNTCSIDPDQDGIFSANLGAGAGAGSDTDNCGAEIASSVFSENPNLWLQVTVGAETLTPRQPIRTVGYALNAETLQGFPINASGALSSSVISMNSSGQVVLAQSGPSLVGTTGTFTVSAPVVAITTASGSNGDITLIPDGTGKVGIANPSPTEKLDVTGNIRFSGALMPNNLPGSSGQYLTSAGAGAPPTWTTSLTATSLPFSGLTSGTNTTAAMVVGAGASLDFTSTGTINASTLLGKTWAAPAAIGTTTPAAGNFTSIGATTTGSGAFTTLTSSGNSTLGTGASTTNTFGAGASSVNTIGSGTTPGALTLHGATTLDNTLTVSGNNLSTLGGNLIVQGTTGLTFNTGAGGDITFANGEKIDNDTDGSINLGATTLELTGGTTIHSNQATVALLNTTTTTLNLGGAATTINIGPTGSGASSILLSGGFADTGCTIDGATGNLSCSGTITGVASNSKWNGLTNPDGNLSLDLAGYTSTFGSTATGALDPWTFNFVNNGASSTTQNALVINNAVAGSFTDTSTENLLLVQQLDTTTAGTTGVANGIKVDVAADSGMTNGVTITNSAGNLTTGLNIVDTAGGNLTTGISLSGTFTTGIDAGNSIITNIGNAATDFDSTGGLTLAGNLSVQGNTTLGDTSGDTVTANAASWTFANDTNFALTGGVNGLSFDTNTLSIDSTNHWVGIGTTGPDAKLDSLATTEQLRLTYTDGSVYSSHTVDSSGNLTIDNTGTKTILADDLQINGADILDVNGNEFLRFSSAASAVDELTIANAPANGVVTLAATGNDTDIALSIDAKGSDAVNIAGTSTGSINFAGGFGSTGCTITTTGNLSCDGTITATGGIAAVSFANITGATNTTAAMVVGTGSSLNFSGSGTINASSLLGKTWDAPAAIGTTTPDVGNFTSIGATTTGTGAFTTLTSSGNSTLGTGASTTNTFGAGASSVNTIGSLITPGALTLHGATTLDNTFSQTGVNTFSTGTGAVSLNGDTTVAAGKNLNLASGTGVYSQIFTGTTTTGITATGNSLTSGSLLSLSSSATGLTGDLAKIGITGTTSTGTALNVTNAGTGTSFRVNDDGTYSDSTPFVIDANGNVGLGIAAPLVKLDVDGSTRIKATSTSVLTGSITPAGATTAVTGSSTHFLTELVAGDRITVNAETRTVLAITDDTHLTVDATFTDLTLDSSVDRLPAILSARDSTGSTLAFINDIGYLFAKRYYDVNNDTYFLEPGAPGTSLNIAGNITMGSGKSITGANLTFGGTGTTTIGGSTLAFSGGTIDLSGAATSVSLRDNTSSAFSLKEGANSYFDISTNNNTESMTLDLPAGGGTSLTANLFTSNIAKTINLGTGTAADTINIGTGATGADAITIGGGVGTLVINTGDWDISSAGDMTNIGAITMDGAFSQTFSGTTTIGITSTGNSLTSGGLLSLSSSAAGLTGDLAKIESTGTGAGITGTVLKVGITGTGGIGIPLSVTNAGNGTSFKVNDDGTYGDSTSFVVDSNGGVGIGTDAPADKLEVVGTNPRIRLTGTGTTQFIQYPSATGHFWDNGTVGLDAFFRVSNSSLLDTTAMTFKANGNIGIGDTTPTSLLTVGNGDLFTVDASGNIVTSGDIAVNGGDLTTSSTTFNLANAATTLNIGSTNVTRTINIGTGTNADTINIGTGGTTADAINIGGLSTTTVGINTGAWTFANDTNFALTGGVNGLSIDGTTFSVDGTDNRVGLGNAAPAYQMHITGSGQTTAALADGGNAGGTLFLQDALGSAGNGGALLFGGNVATADVPQAAIKLLLTAGGGQGTGNLAFSTRASTGATALTERMLITSGGNFSFGEGVTSGTTTLDIGGTKTGFAVCHDTVGGTDDVQLVDCTGTLSDIAEFYPSVSDVDPGDVMTLIPDSSSLTGYRLVKSSTAYDQNSIGVISTVPTGPNGSPLGEDTIPFNQNPQAIGLSGRVAVKVSLENGPIKTNDALTTSSTPGVAMKATKASRIIGRALEAYDGSVQVSADTRSQEYYRREGKVTVGKDPVDPPAGVGKITMLTNLTYYDPNLALNSTGDVIVSPDSTGEYQATESSTGSIIDRIGAFSQLVVAKIKAGTIQTTHLSADSLAAPLATIDNLTTQQINTQTVTAQTATISGTTHLGELLAANASVSGQTTTHTLLADLVQTQQATVASLSAETITTTTATISAVTAGSARLDYLESKVAQIETARATNLTATTATISGTLYAENIANFDQKVADTFRQPSLLATLLNQNTNAIPAPVVSGATPTASSAAELRRSLADLNPTDTDIVINPTALYVKQYFEVAGNSYLAGSVGIGSSLIIGDGLRLSGNELAYAPTDGNPTVFKIQPSGVGKLQLLGDRLVISDTGLIEINGDLRVAGAFTTDGDITTTGSITSTSSAGIKATGPITSTSSISGTLANFTNLQLGTEQLTATGSGTVTTTKPTGKAKLSAGQTEITLKSSLITPQTLIYLTPVGSTNNQVLYVKAQTPEDPATPAQEGEFKVGIDTPLSQDVEFTWWIIN